MKKHIPNLITLGNLLCGTIATIFAIKGDFFGTAILVIAGIIFDFFDGTKTLGNYGIFWTSTTVPGLNNNAWIFSANTINTC